VVGVELDVWLDGVKVWEWTDEVGELDVVVPYENVAGELAPGDEVFGEG
jgi:hypothetical protein